LQINELNHQGYQVYLGILFDFKAKETFLDDLKIPDTRIKIFSFKKAFDFKKIKELERYIKEREIEIIYSTLADANIVARFLKIRNKNLKAIIRESRIADKKALKNKLLDIMLNFWTDKIVAVSEEVKKSLTTYQPMHKKKMIVIENGVEIKSQDYIKALKNQYHNPVNFTILNIGLMQDSNKGQDEILKVFKEIVDKKLIKSPYLILVGEGKMREIYEKYVQTNELTSRVRFIDRVNSQEIEKIYTQADVFVLNSESEGCPNTVLEAMSFALPVISTKVGGVREIIEDGISGFLVDKGDKEKLKEKILSLARNKELQEKIGLEAYYRIKERNSTYRNVKKLINIIKSV